VLYWRLAGIISRLKFHWDGVRLDKFEDVTLVSAKKASCRQTYINTSIRQAKGRHREQAGRQGDRQTVDWAAERERQTASRTHSTKVKQKETGGR
jgi:hypothetical protein